MNSPNVTIRDIARIAGVSPGTVSRAFKSQQGMSEETRTRVFEIANQLGYNRDNLRVRRLRRILFLLHKQHSSAHSNLFYSPVLHGVEDACAEAGIALSFASAGIDQNVADLVRIHEPDAIICAGYFEAEVLQAVIQCGLPLVMVDHFAANVATINDDNVAGAYAAVQHLLERGYKRIAFISGPVSHYSIHLRERGYRVRVLDAATAAIGGPDGQARSRARFAERALDLATRQPSARQRTGERVVDTAGRRVAQTRVIALEPRCNARRPHHQRSTVRQPRLIVRVRDTRE